MKTLFFLSLQLLFASISCNNYSVAFREFSVTSFHGHLLMRNVAQFQVEGKWILEDDNKTVNPTNGLIVKFNDISFSYDAGDFIVERGPGFTQWKYSKLLDHHISQIIIKSQDDVWSYRIITKQIHDLEVKTITFSIAMGHHIGEGLLTSKLRNREFNLRDFKFPIPSDDDDYVENNSTDSGYGPETPDNEEYVLNGYLELLGLSETGFNSPTDYHFYLDGGNFSDFENDFSVTINGVVKTIESISSCCVWMDSSSLVLGENVISFRGVDTMGRDVSGVFTVYVGTATLTVQIRYNSVLFEQATDVTVIIGDLDGVSVKATTNTGSVTFNQVIAGTAFIFANSTFEGENYQGNVGTVSLIGSIIVNLEKDQVPSLVDNNDFSTGDASGWDTSESDFISVVTHNEGLGVFSYNNLKPLSSSELSREEQDSMYPRPEENNNIAGDTTDYDLVLGTSTQGSSFLSRTFSTTAGTVKATIRYLFLTTEVPGGYYGSIFNDYYSLSIRSQSKKSTTQVANEMNSIPYSSFNPSTGATAWMTASVDTNPNGDVVELKLEVGNAADALFQSYLYVDIVGEKKSSVQSTLQWDQKNGGILWKYKVLGTALIEDLTMKLAWASDDVFSAIISDVGYTYTIPNTQAINVWVSIQIPGSTFADLVVPNNVQFLAIYSNENDAAFVQDITFGYGDNANRDETYFTRYSQGVIKEKMRISGQSYFQITSTMRSPDDQARAMFNNLISTARSIQENINYQKNGDGTGTFTGYAAAGDAVIDVFSAMVRDENGAIRSRAWIDSQSVAIRAAMSAQITASPPSAVSKHCGDPSDLNTVDIRKSDFKQGSGARFFQLIGALYTALDENGCYHVEITQPSPSSSGGFFSAFFSFSEGYQGVLLVTTLIAAVALIMFLGAAYKLKPPVVIENCFELIDVTENGAKGGQ